MLSYDGGPCIREAQRLGLADVENPTNLMFLPAYDVKVPGLHPGKKREHGVRAARWAIAKIYPEVRAEWREVQLLSKGGFSSELHKAPDASELLLLEGSELRGL
jgi:hypothetical protein